MISSIIPNATSLYPAEETVKLPNVAVFCIVIPMIGDSSNPNWIDLAISSPVPPAETAQTHSFEGSICATKTSLFSPLESLSVSWSTPRVKVEV